MDFTVYDWLGLVLRRKSYGRQICKNLSRSLLDSKLQSDGKCSSCVSMKFIQSYDEKSKMPQQIFSNTLQVNRKLIQNTSLDLSETPTGRKTLQEYC